MPTPQQFGRVRDEIKRTAQSVPDIGAYLVDLGIDVARIPAVITGIGKWATSYDTFPEAMESQMRKFEETPVIGALSKGSRDKAQDARLRLGLPVDPSWAETLGAMALPGGPRSPARGGGKRAHFFPMEKTGQHHTFHDFHNSGAGRRRQPALG